VDPVFEEQRKNWENLNRIIGNIDKDLKKQKTKDSFNVPMNALSDSVSKFF